VHGELVVDGVGRRTGEPLNDSQGLVGRGKSERGLAGVVGGFDDERVAFPSTARVADPLSDVGTSASIERDDPRFGHHLVSNRNVVGRLDDLVVVVVAGRKGRYAVVQEAALLERTILP